MKRVILLLALIVAVLAAGGAQSAAADLPTVTGFAPTSGPPDWAVTLTGAGFTGTTAVTFTPTDSTYWPAYSLVTVTSDTSIVTSVPFFTTEPLTVTLTVDTLDGSATSVSDFTVDGGLGLSEYRGASGEPITLTGFGFTGATQVVFGTWTSPPREMSPSRWPTPWGRASASWETRR